MEDSNIDLKYDATLLVKMSAEIKEEARKKAASRGQRLSEYVRELVATAVKGK